MCSVKWREAARTAAALNNGKVLTSGAQADTVWHLAAIFQQRRNVEAVGLYPELIQHLFNPFIIHQETANNDFIHSRRIQFGQRMVLL